MMLQTDAEQELERVLAIRVRDTSTPCPTCGAAKRTGVRLPAFSSPGAFVCEACHLVESSLRFSRGGNSTRALLSSVGRWNERVVVDTMWGGGVTLADMHATAVKALLDAAHAPSADDIPMLTHKWPMHAVAANGNALARFYNGKLSTEQLLGYVRG